MLQTYEHKNLDLLDMILQAKLMKAFTIINLSVVLSVDLLSKFTGLFSSYIFSDFEFLYWLVLTMILDLITGVAKVWKNEGFSSVTSKGLRDTVSKCIQYSSFLVLSHIVTHLRIDRQLVIENSGWLMRIALEFLIFIEVKSVYENIIAISPRFDFVQHIGDKLVAFYQETLQKKK